MSLNRRTFIKGTAFAGGAAALLGLAGCAPAASSDVKAADTGSSASGWRTAPDPIPDDKITETVEADLVVVGAGNAGCVAAVSAVEDGASVVLLQKGSTVFCHGDVWAANGTTVQAAAGVKQDGWEVVNDLELGAENRAKVEVLRNWVNYSGEVANWLIPKIEDYGMGPVIVDVPVEADDEWNHGFPVVHLMGGANGAHNTFPGFMQYMVDNADESLLDVRYDSPAVQLQCDESGKIVGVVAEQKGGGYLLCKGTKGIILAAGDYGNDPEMRDEFLPHAIGLPAGYSNTYDTGDGHKIGFWAGAAMQQGPHACNIHYDPGINVPEYPGTLMPWLRVNKNGERFSNEDRPYEQLYAKDVAQPDCMHFQVFDANYATDVKSMGTSGFMRGDWEAIVPAATEAGDIYQGDTLEELAEAMGVPVDAFVATVARYNELCEKGYDEDFGKQARRLKPVAQAPFYALARQPVCLTPLGGLEVNGDMQVLDTEGNVIEGLYAAGNNSGNFFGGLVQRMSAGGMGVGRAVLTGRVAAKRALGINY